jgi:hypothetical protein
LSPLLSSKSQRGNELLSSATGRVVLLRPIEPLRDASVVRAGATVMLAKRHAPILTLRRRCSRGRIARPRMLCRRTGRRWSRSLGHRWGDAVIIGGRSSNAAVMGAGAPAAVGRARAILAGDGSLARLRCGCRWSRFLVCLQAFRPQAPFPSRCRRDESKPPCPLSTPSRLRMSPTPAPERGGERALRRERRRQACGYSEAWTRSSCS